jgi:HAD superfamily hydrolase (TIGR01509 family)
MLLPPGEFEGYLFDCDGTLADSMPLHFEAWTEYLEQAGGASSRFTEELFYAWGGRPEREIFAALNRDYGYAVDPERAVRDKEMRYRALLPRVQPVTAVADLVRRLGAAHAKMAVASGSRRGMVEETLQHLGLREYFPVIVAAGEVPRGKPAPDVFLKAAEALGVEPARCVVFEDAVAGFRAAEAAGMRWVDVRPFYDRGAMPAYTPSSGT